MTDTQSVLIWWFALFAIGSITFPLTQTIFKKFVDRGYIFSKVLGILLSSYLVWFLSSLKIAPFTWATIIISLAIIAGANILIYKKSWGKMPKFWIIFEEAMFFICLAFWAFIRGNEPSIHGLEKFMDYGFMNSILRTTYFPPLDMWLTKSPDYTGGYFINYYYYGHYIAAFLTKLTTINSAVTYNLMLATLFAFTFSLPFSLGANLLYLFKKFSSNHPLPTSTYKLVLCGLLAAFLVAMGGNLHTIYTLFEPYPNDAPVPPWKLRMAFNSQGYWYPNATRFIPFTIHEFPIYSFVVADLHGHVSDIPFVFFTLAILMVLITEDQPEEEDSRVHRLKGSQLIAYNLWRLSSAKYVQLNSKYLLLGLTLSVMYMTNAWDGLIYLILTGLVIFYTQWKIFKMISRALLSTLVYLLICLFFFIFFALPFIQSFIPFASQIGVLCVPASLFGKNIGPIIFEEGKCQKSPAYMLIILWGFFYFNVIFFTWKIVVPKIRKWKLSLRMFQKTNNPHSKTFNLEPGTSAFSHIDLFVIILIVISTLLLLFPEFFYLKDIYPAHYRANTMFKLGYQAFMMLGLVSAYAFFRLIENKKTKIYTIFFLTLFFFVASYPYYAINSYYGGLRTYHGLYGLNWLETQYSDDYKGIEWIQNNIAGQPVILEANGDSYTDYARVSANTGLPTIVGWPVHEWLWRKTYDEAGKRIPYVQALYESEDIGETKRLLAKYNVSYVFMGQLEKEKYTKLNEEKFKSLGRVVFESGKTKVYKLNPL